MMSLEALLKHVHELRRDDRTDEALVAMRAALLHAEDERADRLIRGYLASFGEPEEAYENACVLVRRASEDPRAWLKVKLAAQRSGRHEIAIVAARMAAQYSAPFDTRPRPFLRVPSFGQYP